MKKGQTLLALMIALAISSALLLVVSQFYTDIQIQNRQLLLKLKLQAELQRTVQLIGKDLRRAGFRALNNKLIETNIGLFELDEKGAALLISQANNAPQNSCVLFFYDLNANGCVGEKYTKNTCLNRHQNVAKGVEKELFGYKLNNKMVETKQTYKSAINAKCQSNECQKALQQTACNAGGGWTDLLGENEYEITHLQFNFIAERKGIEIQLAGNLKGNSTIQYETSMVVALWNQ
ncbi:type II secretion system protein J [Pasteurella caecimuris]|uniref:PulJ/GspJ family protein n=1 Tax=Rodentibacter caecimuris TaxID=1796644 RepID=UPI00214F6B52|nr:type II secretion system protein J [Pasteurella caecimuris]MCR1836411.1 type II secretion system protein J [Pasteurella caecimuris]MCU0105838.1 type II secretion system protein J [Pasteurella caecimuris]